jgi:hypothetical protein
MIVQYLSNMCLYVLTVYVLKGPPSLYSNTLENVSKFIRIYFDTYSLGLYGDALHNNLSYYFDDRTSLTPCLADAFILLCIGE